MYQQKKPEVTWVKLSVSAREEILRLRSEHPAEVDLGIMGEDGKTLFVILAPQKYNLLRETREFAARPEDYMYRKKRFVLNGPTLTHEQAFDLGPLPPMKRFQIWLYGLIASKS
jgi:hypothetical protein